MKKSILKFADRLFIATFVAAMIIYAGTKPSFKFDDGLKGATNEIDGNTFHLSYATNNVVFIAWTNTISDLQFNDNVYILAREIGSTNDLDWVQISPEGLKVSDWYWTNENFANATNYDYLVYTNYLPPVPVVTNGVYHLEGFVEIKEKHIAPIKVGIESNGKKIAPLREE